MPFDISNPSCITKIALYTCTSISDCFSILPQISPEFFDCMEDYAASAVAKNLNITQTPENFLIRLFLLDDESKERKDQNEDETSTTKKNAATILTEMKTTIDLSFLRQNILTIGHQFLHQSSITFLDFSSSFETVEKIGNYFLGNCKALKKLNLAGFKNLKRIEQNFLRDCENLQVIEGLDQMSQNVDRVGAVFCCNCTSLRSIDLCFMRNVKTISQDFLFNCSRLRQIKNLHLLNQVMAIGGYSFYQLSELETLDFSGLGQNLTSISNGFLYECRSLVEVDFRSMKAENMMSGSSSAMQQLVLWNSTRNLKKLYLPDDMRHMRFASKELLELDQATRENDEKEKR